MIKLSTAVNIASIVPPLNYDDKLLVLGSCFADNIGQRMERAKIPCVVNPFGTLYNPISIAACLNRLKSGTPFTGDELIEYGGLWHSLLHHGRFSNSDKHKAIDAINTEFVTGAKQLEKATCLIITFGSAYVYCDADGKIVANCHKMPEKNFIRRRLSVDEIVKAWEPWTNNIRCLFTVSPIRHLRDGLHENQLSKATLLLAIDKMKYNNNKNVNYFPAYEKMNDELRDYRFYAEDLIHPSFLAEELIWNDFIKYCFTREAANEISDVEEVMKSVEHRPLHTDSDEYKRFLNKLLLKINQLKEKYPYLDVSKELNKSCCIQ